MVSSSTSGTATGCRRFERRCHVAAAAAAVSSSRAWIVASADPPRSGRPAGPRARCRRRGRPGRRPGTGRRRGGSQRCRWRARPRPARGRRAGRAPRRSLAPAPSRTTARRPPGRRRPVPRSTCAPGRGVAGRDRLAHPLAGAPRSTATDRPAPAGARPRCARRVTSAGAVPRSTSNASATSSALPTALPSGASMRVISQTTRRPARVPRPYISRASSRASSTVRQKAPSPTFTSSTIASAPEASFFDITERRDQPGAGTVPVTSRSA